MHGEVSFCADVTCADVSVTTTSSKVERTIAKAGGAYLLTSPFSPESSHDTIDALVTSMVAAEKTKPLVGAFCDKQEQETKEEQLKTCTEKGFQLSLLKCNSQDSSLFGTPYHIFESCNEKITFDVDANVDKKMLAVTNESKYCESNLSILGGRMKDSVLSDHDVILPTTRNDHLSPCISEQPGNSDGNVAAPGASDIWLHGQQNNVVSTCVPALEKFKSGKKKSYWG